MWRYWIHFRISIVRVNRLVRSWSQHIKLPEAWRDSTQANGIASERGWWRLLSCPSSYNNSGQARQAIIIPLEYCFDMHRQEYRFRYCTFCTMTSGISLSYSITDWYSPSSIWSFQLSGRSNMNNWATTFVRQFYQSGMTIHLELTTKTWKRLRGWSLLCLSTIGAYLTMVLDDS